MTKWQYDVITIHGAGMLGFKTNAERAEELLNRAGQDGWELVSVARSHSEADASLFLFLKRPVA